MNKNTLKAAVAKYGKMLTDGLTPEELRTAILEDARGFSEEDATEIMTEIYEPLEQAEEDSEVAEAPKPKKAEKKSVYPSWDEWKVEVNKGTRTIRNHGHIEEISVIEDFEAVKILRKDVRIEQYTVDLLNGQSHNSGRRFYLSGTVTNGDKEVIGEAIR